MLNIVRVYETEAQAQQAAAALQQRGFRSELVHLLAPSAGAAEQVVRDAVAAEHLPYEYQKLCVGLLADGRSVVSVFPPFGNSALAENILGEFDPLMDVSFPEVRRQSPAPFSDAIGIPVLSHGLTFGSVKLNDNPAPLSTRFGWSLLSSNTTPFSTRFGFKLLSKRRENWTSSFGFPLLSRRKANWTSSFGFPLLSKNSTPLSSRFGLSLLSDKDAPEGLGSLPKLLDNPTPLSSWLKLPLLTDQSFNETADKQQQEDAER